MTADQTQRVTAADVRREVEALANTGMGLTLTEWCRISERLLAGADAIDTAQSQAATIAEQHAEVERLKHEHGVVLYDRTNQRQRAEAAESALATANADYHRICEKWQAEVVRADKATAKIEKLEALRDEVEASWPLINALANWERKHGSILAGVLVADVNSLFSAINAVGGRGKSFRGINEALTTLAALQEDKPHG